MPDNSWPTRQQAMRLNEAPLSSGAAHGQTRTYSDPQNQTALHRFSFNRFARLVTGKITDAVALAHCYRVSIEGANAPIVATLGMHTTAGASGPRQINMLQPGTNVLVALHEQFNWGVILCALPMPMLDARHGLSDFIAQTSRARVDDCHREPLRMFRNGGVQDWIAGRPFDGTAGFESGYISATGLKITIDDFLVQLAVNEACGVFGFYHDSLLRVAGHNLQVWTAGSEREALDDEGEYNDFTGWSPYPWEALGIPVNGDPRRQLDPAASQLCQPWYSTWEPKSDHQQPFHRTRLFHGYLGQGQHLIVAAPPAETPEVFQYAAGTAGDPGPGHTSVECPDPAPQPGADNPPPLVGLHTDAVGLDGRRMIQGAKGILIAKRALIPTPQRLKRPEDGEGDNASNYRPSGQGESGTDHEITGDIATTGDHPHLQRAAAITDLHAYIFNYAGVHPFHYHEKDYDLPEQSALGYANQNQATPEFTNLRSSQYLNPPTAKRLRIDHRYGEQDYYPNTSFFALLEDGGVVIGDGFGAEIKMSGGQITLSAPGDILFKSGRDVQVWGGHDAIIKARNSVDVSATNKDVRLKAEQNVMVLAGNDGSDSPAMGGILLESRAASPQFNFTEVGEGASFGGIILRSPNAGVTTWSRDIYMRTGGGDTAGGGAITIDSNRGVDPIIMHCSTHTSFVRNSVTQFFGTAENLTATNAFTAQANSLGGTLAVNGTLLVAGNIANRGNILAAGGVIATERNNGGLVGELKDLSLQQVYSAIDDVNQSMQELLNSGRSAYGTVFTEGLYASQQAGHDDTIRQGQFTFRTSDQYLTSEAFVMYEDRWQQMSRLAGQDLPTWTERMVSSIVAATTYPYPGEAVYENNATAYLKQDLNLVDVEAGRDKDRASGHEPLETAEEYRNPQYASPQAASLHLYTVIAE